MKILFVTQDMRLTGGIERIISIQANYWEKERGYDVCILTCGGSKSTSFFPLDKRITIRSINTYIKKSILDYIPGTKFLREFFKTLNRYKNAINEESPTLIVSSMQGIDRYILPIIVRKNIPLIGVNHITLGMRFGKYETKFLNKVKKAISFTCQMILWHRYHTIIMLSKTDYYKILHYYNNVLYIPNPILLKNLNIDMKLSRPNRIIMVGRLDYLKGQDRLLTIWSHLASQNPNWILTFVGNGPCLLRLQEKVTKDKLQNQVEFIHNSKNIPDLLKEASIFAFTSRVESFGMVILEAFSCGLPVIAYNCENGPRDLIKNGVNGFLINDGDYEEFQKKLQMLINSESLRKRLGKNAIKYANSFSVENIMVKWDKLFDNIIQPKI